MNIAQIEENLCKCVNQKEENTFIYDFLLAYDTPRATIKRLQATGGLNLSNSDNFVVWKKKLVFKAVKDQDIHIAITELLESEDTKLKINPRFVIVTDFETIVAKDLKTADSLDINFSDLPRYFDFFLPLAGMEKTSFQNENPADVKAAERMAKLYDEIRKDNNIETAEDTHALNVFLSRLLFCFFSEDTGIFEKGQFTGSIASHTQVDGSDLKSYLEKMFEVMNLDESSRKNLPSYLESFPYVNGGLFRDKYPAPIFSRRSRQMVIDSGELDWAAINPDIFGSMIQAVVTPEHRGGLGMHYTSVPNIMKLIKPLFLDDLNAEYDAQKGNKKGLNLLLHRIRKIKIFDPACGSGNFLIISYKELRKLEMLVLKDLQEFAFSEINLANFYGIEIDDFAHEVAILSLWLAEHQMNQLFFKEFGRSKPALPLKQNGNIIHGNACILNWEFVCPYIDGDEIYCAGNPPFLGARNQNQDQKNDIAIALSDLPGKNSLDYITSWFYLGSKYIKGRNIKCAFVSTNSICQGQQVDLFWPNIFNKGIEIGFAYEAFRWTNNAKKAAVVAVIIVGLRNISKEEKYIFSNNSKIIVGNISPYLTDSKSVTVQKRSEPFMNMPRVVYGNQAIDGGYLTLTVEEKDEILANAPDAKSFLRPLYGGSGLMNGIEQWCIWVPIDQYETAIKIKEFKRRFDLVHEFRLNGGQVASSLVDIPYRFRYIHEPKSHTIMMPQTSSSKREYLPVEIKFGAVQTLHSVQVIYDSPIYIMGFLISRIHFLWAKAVAGGIKTDITYSNSLCYNTFPFPSINDQKKGEIEHLVYIVLSEREKYSEKTLSQLYDPGKMPSGLRDAHTSLDKLIESCYRLKPFESDEERLEHLFRLYSQMVEEEGLKGSLFESEIKKKKK